MRFAPPLESTTVLTPKESERHKTAQQRAEDVIYTLNHTFTCLGITDSLVQPAISALTGINLGHGVEKELNPLAGILTRVKGSKEGLTAEGAPMAKRMKKHSHFHAPKEKGFSGMLKRIGFWGISEAAGDIGAAVLVTIPAQRYFPGFMDWMRRTLIEPTVGGIIKHSSERAANKWGDKHGFEHDSDQVVDRARELYQYEMRHLPQMALWTASSIGIHYGCIKALIPEITVGQFARAKAIGAGITAGLVFGARAFAPDKAHKWDETAGKHVVVPLTKTVGKLFGVKERDVDAYHEAQREKDSPQSWAARVGNESPAKFAARII